MNIYIYEIGSLTYKTIKVYKTELKYGMATLSGHSCSLIVLNDFFMELICEKGWFSPSKKYFHSPVKLSESQIIKIQNKYC